MHFKFVLNCEVSHQVADRVGLFNAISSHRKLQNGGPATQ